MFLCLKVLCFFQMLRPLSRSRQVLCSKLFCYRRCHSLFDSSMCLGLVCGVSKTKKLGPAITLSSLLSLPSSHFSTCIRRHFSRIQLVRFLSDLKRFCFFQQKFLFQSVSSVFPQSELLFSSSEFSYYHFRADNSY